MMMMMMMMMMIIMQNLYSAISVSSMALYNNCNFKKEIHFVMFQMKQNKKHKQTLKRNHL